MIQRQQIGCGFDPEQKKDDDVRIINKYDEALLHQVLAGSSDIILCPSFHYPVLQVPLKAIKYGAAPVAISSNHDRQAQEIIDLRTFVLLEHWRYLILLQLSILPC